MLSVQVCLVVVLWVVWFLFGFLSVCINCILSCLFEAVLLLKKLQQIHRVDLFLELTYKDMKKQQKSSYMTTVYQENKTFHDVLTA